MTEQSNTLQSIDDILPIEKALPALMDAVRSSAMQTEEISGRNQPELRSFSVPIDISDPLGWLYRQDLFPKLYWMNREKSYWVAGIGAADRIELDTTGSNDRSFSTLDAEMNLKNPHARYFGGFCFNNEQRQDEPWSCFKSYVFILSLIQISFSGGETTLSCHLWLHPEEDHGNVYRRLLDALDSVRPSLEAPVPKMPEVLKVSYNPDWNRWKENCNRVLQSFAEGRMEKVMLARQTVLDFAEPFSPLLFLMKYPYPENSTYRFYFEPLPNHAFFSFTPERLYRRDGNVILTEALAGTVTKETVNADDQEASELLLNSEKDIREHRFVKDTIYQELQPVCSNIDMEETVQVLQLNRLAHLYTRCTATLRPEHCNDSTVLRQLHPTPAVGGVPRGKSMDKIMSIEPFSRGWYAAPVGWLSRDASEFAVGIRSALVSGKHVCLYSGAGLVEGSNPYSEWAEVDQKIGDILAITQQHL